MTVQENPYPVVSRMIDIFGEWLKHRRELKEMREIDAANFGQIASDLRMSSADLEALVRQGPHAADELPKMLTALGIDQNDLARTEPLCSVTWSASAPCATINDSVTATSPPAPQPRIMQNIAAMPARSMASARGLSTSAHKISKTTPCKVERPPARRAHAAWGRGTGGTAVRAKPDLTRP
jgi:hypothetical protein